VIAFAVGFSATMGTLVIVCLVVSFVLLAPSIVLGYAVKAAERDDAERGL
jgi:4-hydroxybenzoate polyprenyltransferase